MESIGKPLFVFGIFKETKKDEGRVILIPRDVQILVDDFKNITKKKAVCAVESGAGLKSGYEDDAYKKSGAAVIPSAKELYRLMNLGARVKEPSVDEMSLIQDYQQIVAFLHLPALRSYIMPEVIKKTLTLYAMERFWDENGKDPLAAMSTIAGERAVDYAKEGAAGLEGRVVMIIGSEGVVGNAAKKKLLLEGVKKIICIDKRINGPTCQSRCDGLEIVGDSKLMAGYLRESDVVICGARVVNTPAPKIITASEFAFIRKGAVIVDVSIDEGGNCIYSKATAPSDAPYDFDGRLIYAIPNLPGTVPEKSSPLISAAMLPYIKKLVYHLVEGTPLDKCLVNSVITKDSKI